MRNEILSLTLQYASSQLSKSVFIPGKSPVHASGPLLYPENVVAVVNAALDFWYTDWKHCAEFRKRLCEYTGKKHCVLVNSGSSASLIASTALMSKTNKKFVVTTALGFPTTVYPIYQNGKVPIFVDVDLETLSPNWDQVWDVWNRYRNEIAGFVFAHTLGFPYDETRVPRNPEGYYHEPFFISDSCDSLGAMLYPGDPAHVGHFADAMTLSFFPAHHITCGEGGAILTDDDELATIMNRLVNWGRSCDCLPGQSNTCGHRFEPKYFGYDKLPEGWDHKYTFSNVGYNLKMTELQAAMGASQMDHLDDFAAQRLQNFYFYGTTILAEFDEYLSGVEYDDKRFLPSPFGFPVIVKQDAPFTAQELIAHLEQNKIATRRIFGGNLTRQPAFSGLEYLCEDLSNTDYLMENAFWIGLHPALTQEHLDYVVETFYNFFDKKGLITE